MTTIKHFKKLALAAAAASSLAGPAVRAEGIEFHGYMRTQVGTTSEGGGLQCFGGSDYWPIRAKYRLGNECDSYGEAKVVVPFGKADGAWAKYHLMLSLREKNGGDFESSPNSFEIASRENYVIGGGFFGDRNAFENAKIWVGKRYYNRHDIHINDYFYWANTGPGAGIEDVALGSAAKLAVAYHSRNPDNNTGNGHPGGDRIAKRLSTRLYDIPVGPNGTLEGELVYHFGSTASPTQTEGKGYQLFLEHTQAKLLGGYNKLALIYGSKLGAGFDWLPTYAGATQGDEGKSSWRVHDHLYFDLAGTNISGMATVTYATIKQNNGTTTKWTSYGIRPQYNFNENFSLAVEAGHDVGKDGNNAVRKLTKFTIAPQLALSKGFWARPVFRGFVTFASWNDAMGTVANGVFGTKKKGTTYGVQVENWW